MPYIKNKEMRKELDEVVYTLLGTLPMKKLKWVFRGNLNYFIFQLAKKSCKSYSEYADFLSELTEASAEIRRRLLAPYEDEAIKRNGDIE